MVVQTLRIEIQPVIGKGIEVRDDRKTLAVYWLSEAVCHPSARRAGRFHNGESFPQFGGGGHSALMRHQGARCPQRVLLLVATGAGAGIQVRIIRTQATVAPNAGLVRVLPRHVVAGGQAIAKGIFLASAAGIAGLQLAAVVLIMVKAGSQAARLPERQRKGDAHHLIIAVMNILTLLGVQVVIELAIAVGVPQLIGAPAVVADILTPDSVKRQAAAAGLLRQRRAVAGHLPPVVGVTVVLPDGVANGTIVAVVAVAHRDQHPRIGREGF